MKLHWKDTLAGMDSRVNHLTKRNYNYGWYAYFLFQFVDFPFMLILFEFRRGNKYI